MLAFASCVISRRMKNHAPKNVHENDLRAWLRSVWSKGKGGIGLQWIEPAKGSSVGFPDVLIPVWPILIPVELKVTKKDTNESYSSIVRPVKRRFHLIMKDTNFISFYMLAVGNVDCFDVWLAHNSFSPWSKNNSPGELLIASNQTRKSSIDRLQLASEFLRLMNKHNQVVIQIPGDEI